MHAGRSGFTLLEMLVVLVIVSLVSGILMQVFFFIVRMQASVNDISRREQVSVLQAAWFHDVVGGLVSVPRTAADVFLGTADQLSGLTLSALNAERGVPTPVTLAVREQDGHFVLIYRQDTAAEWQLAQWPQRAASFRYLDDDGSWHSEWPPTDGKFRPQLPKAVSLSLPSPEDSGIWITRVRGDREQKRDVLLNW